MNDLDEIIRAIEENEKDEVPDSEIDTSDIPPITDFSNFYPRYKDYWKPVKEQISIRLDKTVVDHLRTQGKGWQNRLNNFLVAAYASGQI